jgi:polyisoprenoid-binding protein YceI
MAQLIGDSVPAQIRYVVDAKASQFFVHAFATGLAAVAAHNPKFAMRDFTGEVKFVPGSLSDAAVKIKIRVTSFDIMDEVSKQDRAAIEQVMFQEVLETRLYPEITFESTDVSTSKVTENLFKAKIGGNLTLHGVTRRHQFDAQVVAGEETLRGYGDFTVKQTEYGLRIASIAGGALKMKDEVRISFYMIGRKQEAV